MADAVVSVRITGDPASFIAAVQSAAAATDAATGEMKVAADSANTNVGGSFKKMAAGVAGYVDGMFGTNFKKSITDGQKAMSDAAGSSDSALQKFQNFGKGVTIAAGVAGVAVVAMAVDMGEKYQQVTTNIAAWGSISVEQAKKITDAFLTTAGSTIYSAQEIGTAYGSVVGQLTTIEGHALNAKQAMQVMSAAMNLAEGSGESLDSSTKALAGTMQLYGIKSAGAGAASDALMASAKASGNALAATAQAVQQVHTKLGVMTPSLADTGALLVDMADHGMKGSRSLMILSSAMGALIKPSISVTTAQTDVATAISALPPALQSLAAQYQNGTISATQLTAATKNLTPEQASLWKNFMSTDAAVQKATQAMNKQGLTIFDVHGKSVGLASIIGQLGAKIHGESDEMALADLKTAGLSSTMAMKLLPMIRAGAAGFAAAAEQTNKAGAAHEAAEKQAQSLARQMDLLRATVKDWITQLGVALIPKLEDLMKIITKVVDWLMKHKLVAEILAGVIGTVLVAAIIAYTAAMVTAAAATIAAAWPVLLVIATLAALGAAVYEVAKHWTIIWDGIKRITSDVVNFLKEVFHNDLVLALMGPVGAIIFLGEHWKEVLHIIEDVTEHFKTEIAVAMDIIKTVITVAMTVIKGVWTATWDVIKGVIDVVWDAIKGTVEVTIDMVIGIVKVGLDLLTGHWSAAWNAVVSMLSSIGSDIWNAVRGIFTGVINTIISVGGVILNTAWNVGIDIINGIINGAMAAWNGLWGFVTSIPHYLWEAFTGIFDLFNNVGIDIINGIINGLSSAAGSAFDAVKKVASGIYHSALNFFGIGSPSKLFSDDVGANIMAGIAQGISGNTHLAVGALTAAAAQFVPAINVGVNGNLTGTGAGGAGAAGAAGGPLGLTVQLVIDGKAFAEATVDDIRTVLYQKKRGTVTMNLT